MTEYAKIKCKKCLKWFGWNQGCLACGICDKCIKKEGGKYNGIS